MFFLANKGQERARMERLSIVPPHIELFSATGPRGRSCDVMMLSKENKLRVVEVELEMSPYAASSPPFCCSTTNNQVVRQFLVPRVH